MKYIIVIALLLLTQCNDDNQFACTEQFVYGLNITIKDSNTNTVITENITVIALDGDYEEQLMIIEGFDTFIGAGERPGNYSIEVTSLSYQTFNSEIIQVDADQCHVIPELVEINLIPN